VSLAFVAPAAAAGQKPAATSQQQPAAAVDQKAPAATHEQRGPSAPKGPLNGQEQATLLRIARDTVDKYVRTRARLKVDPQKYTLTPALSDKSGVFVTLKSKGELRGCIGHVVARLPLYEGVVENAISAAAEDPRFTPVRPAEMPDIHIEVSVLTPFRQVPSAQDFVPGTHGILIEKGGYSAVFLPQVAAEQGWDRGETLRHLCRKAGLPANEWEKPGMKFSVCTGQAFGEHE
jgi:AmmeMemoRadiSam system protein A